MNFNDNLKELGLCASDRMLEQFEQYCDFLAEYNQKVNLTAITEHDEVFIKHFYDSLTISKAFDFTQEVNICDVGAGAGFPTVPLAIMFPNISVTIIDALNKRITFLKELIQKLELNNVSAFHFRAEDFAKDNRASYDIVTARAVARLNILAELCLPLVKKGGYFIALKGSSGKIEVEEAKNAIDILGGKVEKIIQLTLPNESGDREIVLIKKIKDTSVKYPRVFSMINKKPL